MYQIRLKKFKISGWTTFFGRLWTLLGQVSKRRWSPKQKQRWRLVHCSRLFVLGEVLAMSGNPETSRRDNWEKSRGTFSVWQEHKKLTTQKVQKCLFCPGRNGYVWKCFEGRIQLVKIDERKTRRMVLEETCPGQNGSVWYQKKCVGGKLWEAVMALDTKTRLTLWLNLSKQDDRMSLHYIRRGCSFYVNF